MLNRCLFLYRERGKPIEIKVNDVFEQMDMIIIIIRKICLECGKYLWNETFVKGDADCLCFSALEREASCSRNSKRCCDVFKCCLRSCKAGENNVSVE